MQRLFSTFANGWPGLGLLIQRILAAILLIRFAMVDLAGSSVSSAVPLLIGACLGVFLLVGLWTPIVGALVAVLEICIVLSYPGDFWIPLVIAALGGTLAMIGPGAWSIDARLFGRKHIEP